jgi:lysozyme
MSRLKKSGTAAALAVALVGSAEGLRQNAYPDPATLGAPWTICYGHTGDVRRGDHEDIAACKALLLRDLETFASAVEACVKLPMAEATEVAFISLSYNIGAGAFCKSSVVRRYNAGDRRGACDAMLRFNRAAGVVFPGLTRRREHERDLCLRGAA